METKVNRDTDFSIALKAMKDGRKVARRGWNGKNMFLYYVPPANYPTRAEVAKAEFGDEVEYGGYIAMKTSQGNVVPWVASQTDLLADDWYLAYSFEEWQKIRMERLSNEQR